VEHDGFKIRDAFLWNIYDTFTINDFAETLCEDLKIPDQIRAHLLNAVIKSIKEQIEDFITYGGKQMFTTADGRGTEGEGAAAASGEEDVRVLIKLDITVGTKSLIDQFEWDIYYKDNHPEVFAQIMVQELGLSKEFE
jgi:SWI/SNF-related matrix-associated actin-dependent regulator of chromatin subfamily B protein 1